MKTIIVPTDYSENSRNAARYGAALAQQINAKVILFHAFHLPEVATEAPIDIPTLADLNARHIGQLEQLGQELRQQFPVHYGYATRIGFFLDELEKLVTAHPGSLVVMGMRGANLLAQKLMGTLTVSVLQKAAFPVLVVPMEARMRPIERILFACDYAVLHAGNSFEWLQEIATTFRSHVRVLHITSPKKVLTDGSLAVEGAHLQRVLEGVEHQFAWLEEESVAEGIEEGIRSYHADLLVMVPHKRNFLERLTSQSQTRKMAFKTGVPLLSLPNPDQGEEKWPAY